jgi:hypothetical protein
MSAREDLLTGRIDRRNMAAHKQQRGQLRDERAGRRPSGCHYWLHILVLPNAQAEANFTRSYPPPPTLARKTATCGQNATRRVAPPPQANRPRRL